MTSTPNDLDDRLRDLFDSEGRAPELYHAHLEASRQRNRPDRVRTASAKRLRPWHGLLKVAVPAAAALIALAMLLPETNQGGRSDPAIELLPNASAAEVLKVARASLLESGAAVGGDGDVWHGVSRTYHEGELVTINEQWFSTSSTLHLLAAWGVDQEGRQLLLIDRVDGDDTHRIRTFERPEDEEQWRLPPDLNPTNAMNLPIGGSDRQRELPIAMRDWLAAVSAPDATPTTLRAATQRFIQNTPDHFMEVPDLPLHSKGPITNEAQSRAIDETRALDRIRRVLYLLTTVQATPEATAELYALIGGFESLERLSDVTVNDRPAMRIRFDPRDDALNPHRERVLVIDGESGRLIRTETLDRFSWTEIEPARRVERIGDARYLCRSDNDVPCDVLSGIGELEARAAKFALDMAVRYTAHAINRENRALGETAPPLLCMKMSDQGECIPTSPQERARLDEIERDQRALRERFTFNNSTARLSDDDSFATATVLYRIPEKDGAMRTAGNCVRDWRWLTVCRG